MLETNVLGTMHMTQAVVPAMKAQGGGAIVNISSMATVKPHTGEIGYAASKGAINVASKYLALELGAHNIRVNVARMGWMLGVPVQNFVSATLPRSRGCRRSSSTMPCRPTSPCGVW